MLLRYQIVLFTTAASLLGALIVPQTIAKETKYTTGTMLWISDIHFNPFYGGKVIQLANEAKTAWRDHSEWGEILKAMSANRTCSPAGQDANNYLLHAVLDRAASQLTHKPDCIIITGDFLAHDFGGSYFNESNLPSELLSARLYNQFVNQTLAYLALSISKAFPQTPVIATLGNNDAYCGDYDIRGNSGFLKATRQTFQKYFLAKLSKDFETYGGCYETAIPKTSHKFVVLNSVPFISDYPEQYRLDDLPKLKAFCRPLQVVDPDDEFKWLSDKTKQLASGQKAWIVCHIPPGVACWNGEQNWPRPTAEGTSFIRQFSDFYLRHREQLAGVLTGHSHAAEFKLIRDNKSQAPTSFVLMAPSIGRNHGNNASFRVLEFDRADLAIKDYTTHWLDGSKSPPRWGKPFRFTTTYAQKDVSPKSLATVFENMKSGAKAPSGKTFLDQYFFDYSTRNGADNSKPRAHYQKALNSILGP